MSFDDHEHTIQKWLVTMLGLFDESVSSTVN